MPQGKGPGIIFFGPFVFFPHPPFFILFSLASSMPFWPPAPLRRGAVQQPQERLPRRFALEKAVVRLVESENLGGRGLHMGLQLAAKDDHAVAALAQLEGRRVVVRKEQVEG